uniref:Serine/threonine-protein kinase ATM n=1 Tax=Cajanus cajan TaxID=3821 RepID=A0A151RYQ7_CAJCA|nr:Serine/threonine-protein kinase ATM [Cajanus cajan]
MVQGSEQEMDHREVPGGVPERGVGISCIENRGLGGDRVVEEFKSVSSSSSVLETKASVMSENDDQDLADSDTQRLSTWLKMSESEMDMVFSNDGDMKLHYDDYTSEKLDCMFDSESRETEAAVMSVDGSLGDGGEAGRNGGNSGKERKCEDCDGVVMAIASGNEVAEASGLNVDGLGGFDAEDKKDGGDGEHFDGDVATIASECIVEEAAVLSLGGSVEVLGEDGGDGGKIEEEGNGADCGCDGNLATIVSECIEAEAAVLSLDGLVGDERKSEEKREDAVCDGDGVTIASERRLAEAVDLSMGSSVEVGVGNMKAGGKDEVCHENIATVASEVLLAEAAVLSLDGSVGNSVEDGGDEGKSEKEGNNGECDGNVVTVASESEVAEAVDLSVDVSVGVDGEVGRDGGKSEDETQNEGCDGSTVIIGFENRVAEAADVSLDGSVDVSGEVEGDGAKNEEEGKFEGCDGDIVTISSDSGLVEVADLSVDGSIEVDGRDGGQNEEGKTEACDASIEPAELLSNVKQIAKFTDHSSTPDLELLKAQLSAFYHAKGGYKLPDYVDPQPIPGVDEAVAVAEIMGEDRDVLSGNREGNAAEEMVNAIESNGGKKRKGGEDGTASKPVHKKKQLLLDLDTDEDVLGAENDGGDGGKETDEGKSEERNEKGYLSRERKKSKYLSPPFTTSSRGHMEGYIETKSLKVSREAKVSQRIAGAADLHALPVYKGRFFDSSNYQIEDDGEKIIDPDKVQAPVEEVLSQVRNAAISPQIRRQGTSLDQFVDFTYAFRSSIHSSPKQNSGPKRRRKEAGPGMAKSKKGTDQNAAGAVLIVSFWPGSTLPSRSDLISVYGKFGALHEAETDMFRANFTARVSFLRTSDAHDALNHSLNNNPFGSSEVTFQLQYLSDGSKSEEYGERSKHKPLPGATPLSQGSEASKLVFIQQKLRGLTLILDASGGGKSPDMMAKLQSEMKALLEDVNKMVEGPLV